VGYSGFNQNSFAILVNAVNSKHIFYKIDTDCRDGHNESIRGCVYPMIAQDLIRRIIREVPSIRYCLLLPAKMSFFMPSGFNVNIFNRMQELTTEELDASLRT
jgi:hypothetical protein